MDLQAMLRNIKVTIVYEVEHKDGNLADVSPKNQT